MVYCSLNLRTILSGLWQKFVCITIDLRYSSFEILRRRHRMFATIKVNLNLNPDFESKNEFEYLFSSEFFPSSKLKVIVDTFYHINEVRFLFTEKC